MPLDAHLADLMRTALQGRPGISEKRMFGGVCWMLNGNMLCGVQGERFMFRVGKAAQAAALERPGTDIMAFDKRPMTGIVWVEADSAIDEGLDDWINLAARFALS